MNIEVFKERSAKCGGLDNRDVVVLLAEIEWFQREQAAWRKFTAEAENTVDCAEAARDSAERKLIAMSADIAASQIDIDRLTAENARLREVLERIAEPLNAILDEAKAEGYEVNGAMAVQLANDPEYLKSIARQALKEGM